MKKLYILFVMALLTSLSFGQSPRLVLVEEFTGETCGPCASANPGLNAILNGHSADVISLKYQNNIPSTGPNFYLYNTTDISNRTSYYANNYSPHAFIDGNYWNGNAASVTNGQLNTRAAVASPFDIEVSHYFSPANDIIYIHTVIRATQTVSTGTYKARIAVAERDVYGYTSPNGENEYSHVMRKLLPNGTGTALPSTWVIGDSVVINEQWTIAASPTSYPMPIWAMLEAIVWVQNDVTGTGSKQIMQTGHSPALIAVDPAIISISAPTVSCTGNVAATIAVTNNEQSAVTSLDIEYAIDGQTPSVYNWSGTINQAATVNITLPGVSIAAGSHNIAVNITNVNGAPDVLTANNSKSISCGQPLAASTSLTQNFASQTFPPQDWVIEDNDQLSGWKRSAANSNPPGTGCAKMDFYNSPLAEIDILYALSPADLSTAIAPTLTFNVAHQRYKLSGTRSNDKLEVVASTDCGANWSTVWSKSGVDLATVATANTNPYTAALSHWRAESVDLTAYIGQPNVLLAFKATSDRGNNAYVDQVNLSPWNVTGISDNNTAAAVSIFPSPSTGQLNINVDGIAASKMELFVTNVLGKLVKQMTYDKSDGNVISLDLSNEPNGNYLIKIVTENETVIKRALIQK